MIADDGVNEGGQGIEVGYVERADIELRRETCGGRGLVETLAAAEVAHGGDNPESGPGQFDGGEQSEAAGRTSDESDLVGHGSGVRKGCNTGKGIAASSRGGSRLTCPAKAQPSGPANVETMQHVRKRCQRVITISGKYFIAVIEIWN